MPRKLSPSVSRAVVRRRSVLNGQLACSLQGCERSRHALGRHCKTHQRRREKYGHPLGGRVPAYALKRHLRWWESFLKLNPEHPKLNAAIAAIDRLVRGEVPDAALTISWRIPRAPKGLRAHLKRLREGGVTGTELLAHVGALNRLAYSEHPLDVGVLADDDRLSVAFGRVVIHARACAPRRDPREPDGRSKTHTAEPNGSVYLAIGRHLRGQLAGLFAWVTVAEREHRAKRKEETATVVA